MSVSRVLALSPHSDDLAFSLGGALVEGRLAGCMPLTIFSTSAYTPAEPFGDSRLITPRRKGEDRCFFTACRVETVLWLDLTDAPLRRGIAPEEVFDAPLREEEVAGVQEALRAFLSPGTLIAAPLALGGHLDHRTVCAAACRLLGSGRFLGLFYEDLPYAAFIEGEGIEARVGELEKAFGMRLEPHCWARESVEAGKRLAAACYSSQVEDGTLRALLAHGSRVGGERVWKAGLL